MLRIFTKARALTPLVAAIVMLTTLPAQAGNGGTGLPWEGPLYAIQSSLTGPVASAIAIIALFAAGAALVFADEMNGFVKRILVAVMAFALLIAGNSFLWSIGLFGANI